ncbi:MAG: hypothetical protein SAL07_16255 [Oscillatoria sp. PMC 1051.18]|nr:hypothetical protein [Oscillatoria sp. PMC 1051.18]
MNRNPLRTHDFYKLCERNRQDPKPETLQEFIEAVDSANKLINIASERNQLNR